MKFVTQIICVILIILSACSPRVTKESQNPIRNLRNEIAYLMSDPNLKNARVGIYIESLKTGQIIFRHNEHKIFIPASNMKLYTTYSALNKLKPEFRYETKIWTNGSIADGVLNGDLIIKGSGDPTISGRFRDDDNLAIFKQWADSLKDKGITEIKGSVIGDASFFQNRPLGYGWQWDDEPFWYSAQISALSYNDNCIDVEVTPADSIGNKPNVILSPETDFMKIKNNAVTVAADSNIDLFLTRERFENTLLLINGIPENYDNYKESISVINPALYFSTVLTEYLNSNGIPVKNDPEFNFEKNAFTETSLTRIFTHRSLPLPELIKVVNKRSQNFYAEQLLLTMSALYMENADASDGTEFVTSFMKSIGVPESEFVMYDGSGLSRVNMISPLSMATMLRHAYRNKYFEYFYDSLPIAGKDGTLKRRMRGTSAAGNVRAKTGYVQHVRGLSGYVTSADDEEFIFSILVNNYTIPTPAVNLFQDRICELISNFSRN